MKKNKTINPFYKGPIFHWQWKFFLLFLYFFLFGMGSPVWGDESVAGKGSVVLKIESWRSRDIHIWENILLPAFQRNKKHKGIQVVFSPTPPRTYDKDLEESLKRGTAGDLIFCRSYDISLELFRNRWLLPLTDMKVLKNFDQSTQEPWRSENGKDVFCLPVASVIHGFMYNKKIFKELQLKAPETEEEFFGVLERIRQHKKYVPLVIGTSDGWESNLMAFQNIGPNYWKGEKGRLALIQGKAKFTDPPYIELFRTIARWRPYLPPHYRAQSHWDSHTLFVFGRGAVYPGGSFEISEFTRRAAFEVGTFPPPVRKKGDRCYISDHIDFGIGINRNSKYKKEAKLFIDWLGSVQFSRLFTEALPGFYTLSKHKVSITNPLAREFLSWRKRCESTIRNDQQILSRVRPRFSGDLTVKVYSVLNGTMSPATAAIKLQQRLIRNRYQKAFSKEERDVSNSQK